MFMKILGGVAPVSLILRVKTDNVGASNDDQFTLQVVEGAVAFNYDVEYDGQTLTGLTDDVTLTFPSGIGTYDIIISGIFPKLFLQQSPDKSKLIECKQWGNTGFIEPSAIQSAFAYNNLLTTVSATDVPVGSFLYLSGMFSFCSSLVSIPNLNNWDVSNVTTMASMFREAPNFNGNMSSWNTSNVTDMSYMLSNVPLFNGDISSWNVSSVSNFKQFLYNKPIWNNDLSGWDVSGATNMERMFQSCPSFNSNISNWNVSGVTNMYIMFAFCTSFDQDLSSWQISQVTNLQEFMTDCKLSTANYDALLIGWDAQGAMSYSGTVDFGSSQYTLGGTAEVARTSLIAKWGGIIDGGGIAVPVTYTTNLVASYSFDTDFSDYTGNNPLTAFGGATAGVTGGKVSDCAELDGSSDYTIAVDSDDFSFTDGTNDLPFSISFWANFKTHSSNPTNASWIITKRDASTNEEYQVTFFDNSFQFWLFSQGGNSAYVTASLPFTPITGGTTWQHFTVTYDGSQTFSGIKMYIDGVSQTLTDSSVGAYLGMINGSEPINIGSQGWNPTQGEFDGKLDEFHVWKDRELTSAEVLDIYNTENLGNSILPIQIPLQNIISYYKFENNVLDEVGVNNGIATDITYTLGKIGNSAVFNGSTSKVLLPTNFLPYSPSFSVHCVFKATDINTEYRLIALSDNVNMPYILLRLNNTVLGRIGFYVWNSNSPTEIFSDSYDSTTYTQVTATIVENGDFKLYINGNLIDTKSISYFSKLSDQNYLGSLRNGNGRFFNGDIDDTSFWNKELSQAEITEIYNTQNSGNSLLPLQIPLANIISEYKFENNALDTVGTNNGTANALTYASGLVGQTGVFNGTTSDVQIADTNELSFGNGTSDIAFSISLLIRFDSLGAPQIIEKRNGIKEYQIAYASNNFDFRLFDNRTNGFLLRRYVITPSIGVWYSVIATYDGSSSSSGVKLYFDGIEVGTTSGGNYTAMENGTSPVYIGKYFDGVANSLDGDIDCVRFWSKELTQTEITLIATDELNGIDINP